ncbi:aminotransferase class III-fold pyridoxal phosphate-dependent enzyme [Mesorhizobium sp. L48C026A00]|uniref:aminotransferase class III-fold pyridoxal phosphate-dependent enzyme n=1 Tax=Mesorhizobium sp. L48C026A00 TaxID=1287182 RepID=UPI00247710CA|nr:aminotransferase class III-fold pyridoxal phosphate-dependent enzyme [Mesorhizobium sp. L48C026A00]
MPKRPATQWVKPGIKARVKHLRGLADETAAFINRRPRSRAVFDDKSSGFFNQVPLYWMRDWPMPFPVVISTAKGSEVVDLDGNRAIDFCLGDTGAMFGHGPKPIVEALARTAQRGLTTMLPSEDAHAVGRLLSKTFGMSRWQVTATASDANRFAFRVARAVTSRNKILVFDGCYHKRWLISMTVRRSAEKICLARLSILPRRRSAFPSTI